MSDHADVPPCIGIHDVRARPGDMNDSERARANQSDKENKERKHHESSREIPGRTPYD